MENLKTFQYKGKTYRMEPNPKGTSITWVCQKCPLKGSCDNNYEVDILIDLKGGYCRILNAHPVLAGNPVVQERTILLKKTGPFRNSNEENDWNKVLTIVKSWGWIQD